MRFIQPCIFIILAQDLIVSGTATSRGLKKAKKSKKTSKIETIVEFLPFALNLMDDMNAQLCNIGNVTEACEQVTGLVAAGAQFTDTIAPYYSANYRAMTLSYPTFSLGPRPLFIQAIRIHRTLGLGNSLRLQGHAEETVNKAYWNHWNLLKSEDENMVSLGDGIETYCRYISNEYETLKAFAVDNFDEDFSASPFFGASPMYNFCMTPDVFVSYIARSDWEHHRREVIGSLMSTKDMKAIVVYTIWHWESLFAGAIPDGGNLVIDQLIKSFTAFIPNPAN
mmetsp:Transcript_35926/g.70693  ORF Transcript_35926/g.70693 Transcript_35926/m.70693 type:complete len:281 (+) Transcript_35926:135-977(+)